MSSRTISVALQAKIDGYTGPLKVAAKETEKLGAAARKAGDEIDGAGKKSEKSFKPGKLRPVAAEWEKLQDTAVNNSQAWGDVSNRLLTAGAAAGVAVALVTREYASFDAAMSGVASTGDDARQSIDALREAAIKSGADTAFSATEAANGVEELARAGVSAKDMLSGGLTGALDLAAAGQLQVADAAGIASVAMTQFKLSGEQIPHLADLLAAGAGKAMGGVDDLGMALKQGGLVASQFGLSIEETVGGLSAFAASGLLGSDAGTSLKTMLLKLASPSKEAAKLMDDLGISAYDASGQFVGLESLAGQLQTAFEGQSDATRDAALATIFGTDAIRAANVLYQEGATGIADWTTAVDDAGYAAQTAATLQDNLVGDLEKLGGAWSTLAIQMGEGADGPLRGLVQGLTALVDIAGQSPVAAQAVLGITAGLAGLALAAGGIMKGVTAVAEFRTSLATLTEAYPKLAKVEGVIGKLGKGIGVAAAALVGLQLLGAALESLGTHVQSIDLTSAAVKRLITTTEGVGALDSTFRDAGNSAKDLAFRVNDISSAAAYLRDLDPFTEWMDNHGIMNVLGGVTSESKKVRDAFAGIDQTLSSMNLGEATAGFSQIRDVFKQQGVPVEKLIELFPSYAAEVQSLAAANGLGELSGNHLADAMEGVYPPLIAVQQGMADTTTAAAAQAGAYDEAAAAAEAQAKATEEAAQAAGDALKAHLDLLAAIDSVNDAQRKGAALVMGEQAAYDQWQQSLDDVSKQVEKNGTSLDINSEKGRANRAFLRDMAETARDVTDAMYQNGAGVDVVNAKMSDLQAQFLTTVDRFGGAQAAADALGVSVDELAAAYGLVPNYVETVVVANGAKVSAEEAAALNAQLEGLPFETRLAIVTTANEEGAKAAQAALDAIPPETLKQLRIQADTSGAERARAAIAGVHGKTVYVSVQYQKGGYTPSLFEPQRRATGGRIIGPGTGTSDDVPLLASNGEFMVRTWAAQKIGYERMEYINRTGSLPRFADGGVIGRHATSGTMPLAPQAAGPAFALNLQQEISGPDAQQVAALTTARVTHAVTDMATRRR